MINTFDTIINSMKTTIKGYDYFVCWSKVINNTQSVEIPLSILSTLIGKDNVKEKLRDIIKNYPEVVPVIPMCLAIRDKNIDIFTKYGTVNYKFLNKKEYTNDEIDKIILFTEKTGFLNILKEKRIKNLYDYYFGIEIGLDTNARKNRTGILMENLVEEYIMQICNKNYMKYISQASASKIKNEFNIIVPTDKSKRRFDFVIQNKDELILIETNFYNSGGSKLKSVAGEFITLDKLLKTNKKIKFVWITDGNGWLTAKKPLEEAYYSIDYVLNIKNLEDGYLEKIVLGG